MKNKIIYSFGLALTSLACSVLPSQAQLVFQFEQQGGNTVVTGSGSATTGASGSDDNFVGAAQVFGSPTGPLMNPNLPVNWVSGSGGGAEVLDASSSLVVGGITLLRLSNSYFSGPQSLFLAADILFPIPANTLVNASGSATFANPYSELFSLYTPGTTLQMIPGVLHFIIGVARVETAVTTVGGRRRVVRSYRTTNYSAIASAEGSGMMMGHMLQSSAQGAANTVLRDLRGEIFTNGTLGAGNAGNAGVTSTLDATADGSSSLLRYFTFMQGENTSYKVALGLAEPEERIVEVASTLTGGGLPYAMMGIPMVGGAATVQIVEAGGGKAVIDDAKAVVETAPAKNWRMFVSGDFSAYDQDPLNQLINGFETTTYAGSVGFDYRFTPWLKGGLAWSRVWSDTNAAANLGSLDLEGNMVSVFTTATFGSSWADLLYSYGSFNNDISRNTGLGSRARGDTDSNSHNVRLNLGHNFQVGRSISTGPVAGLRYGAGNVDSYSERGGSVGALDYAGTDFESMVSRLGWQASHVNNTGWGRIISQVRLAWEHEYMPENGTVSGSLQTSPFALVTGGTARSVGGYTATSDGATIGTDWLSAGAGLKFELAQGWSFLADYEGVFFRTDAGQDFGSAKVSYAW